MNLSVTMEKLADEIDGKFLEYSTENTIITVPVSRHRYQNVTGYLLNRNNTKVVEFMSRVCELNDDIDHKAMLELNQELFYSKVVIHEGYLKVAAAALLDHCTEDLIKDMVLEVARVADDLEHHLVGADVN
ncbi:hypothetical protein GXP67_11100 [Rhodocytophaga rosea]|uniref:Uncharacterized protein n=1 Tax=Rhodocytophaga rosea TaxID=2704465 RepID=A0A6C0GHG9_9BACT|nr:hypothetical protein [Rhodocytophaga rosea]QHT67153.1 hypothetical protein GXP67_11100 [Rhodocytophaga rosea]